MSHLFPQNAPGFGWDQPPQVYHNEASFWKWSSVIFESAGRESGRWEYAEDTTFQRKERATKIIQFRKKSRIWRYRKYNSQENLVLLIVNDPKGMRFFDFRKDLLSFGILKKSQLPLALRFGSFKRNAQGWMIRCFQWNRGKTWYHPPIIQHRPREVPTDLKVWILFNLTSTSIQKLPFWEVSSNTLRGIWRLLLTPLIVGAPEVFLQTDNSSEP